MENNLRQTENKAYVVGILKEKKIEFKPAKTSGRQMAFGYLTLLIKNDDGIGEIKVKVQQFELKKDGTANSLYKGLQTVQNTYVSILEGGEENADLVKIEGQIEDGAYYSVNKGEFVEKLEIKGTFINRLTDKTTAHCCKVGFEGHISKIVPKENELEVEMIGIGYNGIALPVTGIIPTNLVAPFQARYQEGCTCTLNFSIVNSVEVIEVQAEAGFGETLGEKIERHTTKRVIFGGAPTILFTGMPNAITRDEVLQAQAIRQSNLDTKKEDAEKRSSQSTNIAQGFGALTPGVGSGFALPNSQPTTPGGFPIGAFSK